jgi:hypothetical protein
MLDQLATAVQGEVPAWASLFATLLLALAAAIARRISRRSAKPQGERLGSLETAFELERVRRLQIEAAIRAEGIPLAWWPPDGAEPPARSYEPYSGRGPWPEDGVPLPYDDDDQAGDVEPRRAGETRIDPLPIPPLPEYPHHRR